MKTCHHHKFDSPLPRRLASCHVAALPSCVYASAIRARNFFYDRFPTLSRELPHPVISIGGIRAGGVGKTPVAQLIGRHIIDNLGRGAAFLSRGYGRAVKRTVIVKPYEEADWEETGDEPCMIHNNIPESWLGIGADRNAVAAAMTPLLPAKSVFILDDGFQRRQTRRDLDVVCLSESAFDDRMIPAGYLREPVSSLSRAHVILIIGAEDRIEQLRAVEQRAAGRLAGARLIAPDTDPAAARANADGSVIADTNAAPATAVLVQHPLAWVNAATGEEVPAAAEAPFKNPLVICGIARPARFIGMLRALAVEPSEVKIFADHYNFKKNDFSLDNNVYCMEDVKAVLTTEKDAVRLRSKKMTGGRAVWYLKVGLRFADTESEARVFSRINDLLT